MRNANIGTHHTGRLPSSSRHMNGQDIAFSSARRRRRAERGEVSHVGVSSTTGENDRAYSRRTSRVSSVQEVQRTTAARRILLVLLLIVAVVGIGAFVAVKSFFGISSGRIALNDASAAPKLVAAKPNEPHYTLITADLDATNNCDTDVDMVVLARIDDQANTVSFMSVPTRLRSQFSDGNVHPLSEAVYWGGLGQLIQSVSGMFDQSISHVITLDQAGIEGLVDSEGGLEWALTEEVDDPTAGSLYIPAGTHKLSGEQVSQLLRSVNVTGGMEGQGKNQCLFLAKMLQSFADGGKFHAASKVDKAANFFHTDMPSGDLTDELADLKDFQADGAYCAQMPCIKTSVGPNATYQLDNASWKAMLELFKNGGNPNDALATKKVSVDPSTVTVTVKNGAGVTGGASSLAASLTNAGFKVEEVGNTDSPVYTETLVIYLKDEKKDAAQAVADTLGNCRVIDGIMGYSFETDVMVVLGSDWMPEN